MNLLRLPSCRVSNVKRTTPRKASPEPSMAQITMKLPRWQYDRLKATAARKHLGLAPWLRSMGLAEADLVLGPVEP